MDKKSCKNILIYDILYKTMINAKPLRIRFDKVDEFIIVYDGTKYLLLFGPEKFDAIYNRIRYHISQKCGITYVFTHNYSKSKLIHMILYDTFHNVIILVKSVFKKNQNHYGYKIFLQKGCYQLPQTIDNK